MVGGIQLVTIVVASSLVITVAQASKTGDTCRKKICDAVFVACMAADHRDNPLAYTDDDKRAYCSDFSVGCMSRSIASDTPWYAPETVKRFLQCPS